MPKSRVVKENISSLDIKKEEQVNHPSHYNAGSIEVIDAIESFGFGVGFCAGNAIKYIARHEYKGKTKEERSQDLEKAAWYIDRLLHYYESKDDAR